VKTPPPGAASTAVWNAFNNWCAQHSVPDETEDWQYLWDCYFDGFLEGMKVGVDEANL